MGADIATIIASTVAQLGMRPVDINFGFCERFAQKVAAQLGDGATTLWFDDLAGNAGDQNDISLDTGWLEQQGYRLPEWLCINDLNDDFPGHCFIRYQGRYYDSETPDGVESPFLLPYIVNRYQ